eukprot:g26552.t1
MPMFKSRLCVLAALAGLLTVPSAANAHFLWLATSDDGGKLHLYFSEEAEADDPALLKYTEGVTVHKLTANGKPQVVELKTGKESKYAGLATGDAAKSLFVLKHDFGVISRGGKTFLLRYYAKTGPQLGSSVWKKTNSRKQLALDLVPVFDGKQVRVKVLWQGKPAAGSQVKIAAGGMGDIDAATDKAGTVSFAIGKPGMYSIRARFVEKKTGESKGKKYDTIRHYATLALRVPAKGALKTAAASQAKRIYPDHPKPMTSFGAAIADGYVYTYGGHMGEAHTYSVKGQSNVLRRMSLKKPSKWETVATGPRLQGLAMVSYDGKLYRVGGFTAMNDEGEKRNLQSQSYFARFDPKTKKWTAMPALPEPRSSHDAVVMGSKLYVIGGWKLHGEKASTWHKTAWVMDLASKTPEWQAVPTPPFERRALSLAAYKGKIYAIGGMQRKGGPTNRVAIYDPATKKWSEGPNLNGKPFEGFGNSSFAVNGRLYASTIHGMLQQLSKDGKSWKTVRNLERARFFHRMLPLGKNKLLFVGGASMKSAPVVWKNRLYLTSVEGPEKEKLHVCSFDTKTGRKLWQKTFDATTRKKSSMMVSRAAPTPVVDEQGVYAMFESGDIHALTHAGQPRWKLALFDDKKNAFQNGHGYGASPAQTKHGLVVLVDHAGPSYLLHIAKSTGKTLWKTDRTSRSSWSSPHVTQVGKQQQIVVSSNGSVDGYDAKSGRQLWSYDKMNGNTVPSAVVNGDRVYVGASQRRGSADGGSAVESNCCLQITPGIAPGYRVVWKAKNALCSFAGPLAHRGHVYFINRVGAVYCLDANTGEQKYLRRTGGSCWAQPIGSGDYVYFFGRDGRTSVLKAGAKYELVATNSLWDKAAPPTTETSAKAETAQKKAPPAAKKKQGGRRGGYGSMDPVVYAAVPVDGAFFVRLGSRLYRVGAVGK